MPALRRARSRMMLPLSSSAPDGFPRSRPSMSRAISSVATDVPRSWATMKYGSEPTNRSTSLGQVGLLLEAVVVVAGLVREAEAQEVEGEQRLPVLDVHQPPPVVGARGHAAGAGTATPSWLTVWMS